MKNLKLPDGLKLSQLKGYWDLTKTEYASAVERMRYLDGADRTKMWETLGLNLPKYQLKPETNHVNYIKDNVLNSVYTISKWAEAYPITDDGPRLANEFNIMFDALWEQLEVQDIQLSAGERAALLNVGITQVGWDKDKIYKDPNGTIKGMPELKNIDPMRFRMDPFADSLQAGRFCIYNDEFHIDVLKADPKYADQLKDFDDMTSSEVTDQYANKSVGANKTNTKYVNLIIYWVKVYNPDTNSMQLHVIHTIDNKHVIAVEENIMPSMYPFAILYCNKATRDPVGVSEPAKIFMNSFIYNLMHSIIATQAYKASRPPKFVVANSGLNLRTFSKYSDDPGKVFQVKGDASKVVHTMQFPQLPAEIGMLMQTLPNDISKITGIDDRYTGRDTGSILTTGGTDNMLTRVTLRDSTKIINFEKYTKDLTDLILRHMLTFSEPRTFSTMDPATDQQQTALIDFPSLNEQMDIKYRVSISSELPKSKARLAQSANMLMEKQMQYQMNPPLLTPQEWLEMQDFPNKTRIMRRLKEAEQFNKTEDVTKTLFEFSELVKQGIPPEQAVNMIVEGPNNETQNPDNV